MTSSARPFDSLLRAAPALVGIVAGLALSVLGPSCTHACDASNCSDGCCDGQGVCWVGNTKDKCGLGGAQCVDCGFSSAVACKSNGVCGPACDAASCPNSCCDSSGHCASSLYDFQCGKGGVACADCTKTSQKCTRSSVCGSCAGYVGPCNTVADCCPSLTQCVFDGFYGRTVCKY